ncbi:27345_t:CDS:2, partial [Racocetra persica]
IIGFGDVVADDYHPEKSTIEKNGQFYVYPIDKAGNERSVEKVKEFLRAKRTKDGYEIEIGKEFGLYKTVWIDSRYNAVIHGTKLIKDGTTAHAVLELNKQDGGNRKFILCEQMDYIETVTKERIRKVCEIDNKEPKSIDNSKQEFTDLPFIDQQKFLISLLDKNLLYVPYCDMEDKDYGISDEVKKLNYGFYENKVLANASLGMMKEAAKKEHFYRLLHAGPFNWCKVIYHCQILLVDNFTTSLPNSQTQQKKTTTTNEYNNRSIMGAGIAGAGVALVAEQVSPGSTKRFFESIGFRSKEVDPELIHKAEQEITDILNRKFVSENENEEEEKEFREQQLADLEKIRDQSE